MLTAEPNAIALLLVIASALMALAVLLSRTSDRFGVPLMLGFLVVGMLAGEDGPGGIQFSNHSAAFRMGTAALALILFDGGLNTPLSSLRFHWKPAGVLASLGVLAVTGIVAVVGWILGFPWKEALLIGAILSCTDAAAVFAILRGQNLRLRRRVGITLELEAGLNDPMSVVLTMAFTALALPGGLLQPSQVAQVPLQLAIGAFVGWGVGYLGSLLLSWAKLPTTGLYPVLTVALAGFGFGLPTLLGGSGFLGVFIAGLVIGNRHIPFSGNLLRVHAALSWIAQIMMFLILGLLVTPSRLGGVAWQGLALGVLITVVARPAAILVCLAPFGFSLREMLYIGWTGLRGAVPIVLATIPVMAGVPQADHLFHVVFVVVVVGTLLPGATVRWVTEKLGMQAKSTPTPLTHLDLHSEAPLDGTLLSYVLDGASPGVGGPIGDLSLPGGAWILAVVKDGTILRPAPDHVLRSGEQVFITVAEAHRAEVEHLFDGSGD